MACQSQPNASASSCATSAAPPPMRTLAEEGLGMKMGGLPNSEPALYDFRSRFCALWNHTDGYLYSREQTIAALREFKRRQRGESP